MIVCTLGGTLERLKVGTLEERGVTELNGGLDTDFYVTLSTDKMGKITSGAGNGKQDEDEDVDHELDT